MTAGTREGISHDIGVDGSVDIRGDQGAVELRAVDGTSIRVQASGDRSLEDAFRIETGSGSFKMSATTSEGPGRHLVGRPTPPILVDVPRTARVRVETVSGEIQADGLHGTQRYRTMSGDMRLESTLGRIALDTVSGDVRIRSGGDLTIEARTVSGDLDVAAETIRSLQTQATSGEVRLAGRFASGWAVRHRDGVGRRHDLTSRCGQGRGHDRIRRRPAARSAHRGRAGRTPHDRARSRRPVDRLPLDLGRSPGHRRPPERDGRARLVLTRTRRANRSRRRRSSPGHPPRAGIRRDRHGRGRTAPGSARRARRPCARRAARRVRAGAPRLGATCLTRWPTSCSSSRTAT